MERQKSGSDSGSLAECRAAILIGCPSVHKTRTVLEGRDFELGSDLAIGVLLESHCRHVASRLVRHRVYLSVMPVYNPEGSDSSPFFHVPRYRGWQPPARVR